MRKHLSSLNYITSFQYFVLCKSQNGPVGEYVTQAVTALGGTQCMSWSGIWVQDVCSFDYMHIVCLVNWTWNHKDLLSFFRPSWALCIRVLAESMEDVFVEIADSQNIKDIEGAHITKHSINCENVVQVLIFITCTHNSWVMTVSLQLGSHKEAHWGRMKRFSVLLRLCLHFDTAEGGVGVRSAQGLS